MLLECGWIKGEMCVEMMLTTVVAAVVRKSGTAPRTNVHI